MHSLSQWQSEEQRLYEHLSFIGYTAEDAPDPHGWRFVTNPMAPPLGFRAGPHFLCFHAEYHSGSEEAAMRDDLLREVNRLNAVHWLVRCALITRRKGANSRLSIRLQANVPLGLPAEDLGACILAWVRESTYIERAVRLRSWASADVASDDAPSHDAVDDHPSQRT